MEVVCSVHNTSTCDYGGVDDEEDDDETNRKSEAQKDRLP
jgi:hypothetical protein